MARRAILRCVATTASTRNPAIATPVPQRRVDAARALDLAREVLATEAAAIESIASRLGRFLYTNTQSRIHVIVTHGFLRRLARRELDKSVTGRFSVPAARDIPAPSRERAQP